MTEAGDSYQPPGASEQPPFSQGEYDAVWQRMEALRNEAEERGTLYPPEFDYLNIQRRIIGHWMHGGEGPVPAEYIENNLVRSLHETEHNERAHQGVDTLRWAFLAYALPHDRDLSENWLLTYALSEQFNKMQREQMQQTGQPIEGVTLNPEQSQTLVWLLDHAAIPHTLSNAENHVSLAPVEQTLQEAAAANAERYLNDSETRDHETHSDVPHLMGQWKEQNNQES